MIFWFKMIRYTREGEEDIAWANLIESLQKQADEGNFSKRVTGEFFIITASYQKEKNKMIRFAISTKA